MIKTIYITHHTHLDIGFTDMPSEVLDQHLNYMDDAIRFCENDPDYHWTVETAYLVEDYLTQRSSAHGKRLIKLLRNGQIEMQGMYTQMLTEVASASELLENIRRSVELGRKYDFPVNGVMIDDIAGYTGRFPSVLNLNGLRYLIAGVGSFQALLPWTAQLPHLFYLVAPDGGKTLMWNIGIDRFGDPLTTNQLFATYGMAAIYIFYQGVIEFMGIKDRGIELNIAKKSPTENYSTEELFHMLLCRLERENYPYEELLLQYGGDNRGPAPFLAELIRLLNKTGKFPELKLVTPSIFFDMMAERYGDRIPCIKGALCDPWVIRPNTMPAEIKSYRYAQRKYQAAVNRSMISTELPSVHEKELAGNIMQNLLLTADHTYGLSEWNWQALIDGNDVRGRVFDRFRQSWKKKSFYVEAATDSAEQLDRRIKNRQAAAWTNGEEGILVWNDTPCTISGYVTLYFGSYARILAGLTDSKGRDIPFQPIGENRYLLKVDDVPSGGALFLKPELLDSYAQELPACDPAIPVSLEYAGNHFEFDPVTGRLMAWNGRDGTAYLDQSSQYAFGELVYEEMVNYPPFIEGVGLIPWTRRKVYPIHYLPGKKVEDGPLFLTIRMTGILEGTPSPVRYERDLRIWKDSGVIDLLIRLDKPERPEKEICHIAFPFAGKHGSFCFDQNFGLIDPEKDLLPGSMQDAFYCSRFAAVKTATYHATLLFPDAPIVEFGRLTACDWRRESPLPHYSNHIYSYLYNNISNTDCAVWRDILETFSYRVIVRDNEFDPVVAQTDWYELTGLQAAYYTPLRPSSDDQPNVFSLTPEALRLHEIRQTGNCLEFTIENFSEKVQSGLISNRHIHLEFTLLPYEIRILSTRRDKNITQ